MSIKEKVIAIHEWLVPDHENVGIQPYFWLIYLGFPALRFFFGTPDPAVTLVTIASMVLFVPLFFMAYAQKGNSLLIYAAAMVAIGTIVAPFNQLSNVYFVYAASTVAFVGSTRVAIAAMVVIAGSLIVVSHVIDASFTFWAIGILLVFMIGGSNLALELKNRTIRQSRAEAERMAAVAERERIARDLHDLLGHSLSMITLKSELAVRLFDQDPERAKNEMREVEVESRRALADVRRTVSGYRTADLAQEIQTARAALAAVEIQATLPEAPPHLPEATELALCMLLREAITNVIRHSEATACKVTLERRQDAVILGVSDNGCGKAGRESSGLMGMRERCAAHSGTLMVKSTPEVGTSIEATLHLAEEQMPASLPMVAACR